MCLTLWSSGVMLYVMLACRYPVGLLRTILHCLSPDRLFCVGIELITVVGDMTSCHHSQLQTFTLSEFAVTALRMVLSKTAPHQPGNQERARVQFEDPSDARLSNEEARRKIMQRTLTGAAQCAHLACLFPCVHLPALMPLWSMAAYNTFKHTTQYQACLGIFLHSKSFADSQSVMGSATEVRNRVIQRMNGVGWRSCRQVLLALPPSREPGGTRPSGAHDLCGCGQAHHLRGDPGALHPRARSLLVCA